MKIVKTEVMTYIDMPLATAVRADEVKNCVVADMGARHNVICFTDEDGNKHYVDALNNTP